MPRKISMRYFVKLHGKITGPLDSEQLRMISDMGSHALLCPEGKDPQDYKNWDLARSFPEVRDALAKPRPAVAAGTVVDDPPVKVMPDLPDPEWAKPPPAQFPWLPVSLLIAVTVGVIVWRAVNKPPPPPPPPPVERATEKIGEVVSSYRVPSCHSSLGKVLGPNPAVTLSDKGMFKVDWGPSVQFAYDPATLSLMALTPDAGAFLNMEAPCPSH